MRANKFSMAIVLMFSFGLAGCETSEQNKIAQAQKCLDGLKDSATAAEANACLNYIAGIQAPEAYVIRCTVDFIAATVTPTVFVNAYEAAKNLPSSQQPAVLMSGLLQQDAVPTYSTTVAQATYNECLMADTPSLTYVAGMSIIGTAMAQGATSGTAATYVTFCKNPANYAACNATLVGQTVQDLSTSYCVGDYASTQTCQAINAAASAGSAATVGAAFFTVLQ